MNKRLSFFVMMLFFQSSVLALEWTIRPSLTFEEIFSDNIRLTDSNKRSAFVTELSPGVSINGTSSVNSVNLNYRMQNLYNANGDSGLDINNQLQMNTHYEFVVNRLMLDSSASISQQNVSNRRIASDNISGGGGNTTVSTFQISPYWRPHFKNFADGEFRVTYDRVNTDGGNSQLSNSDSFSQNISLNSGNDFSYINWSLAFNNSRRSNNSGEDVNFQDSLAGIRYAIGRYFSVFARTGHSNNSFASNSDSSDNGVFYTFGGQWQPSQRFRIEAGYGNNSFVTVAISPFNRLNWITTYSNNDIGLNTGNVWNTQLNYNTRRSVWTLSYSEGTTTTQQLLLENQIFLLTDNFNQANQNIVTTQDFFFNTRLPTLTDEVFITKRAGLSFSFRTGKSNISADVFRTIRTFEQIQNDETVTGISASWNWQFSRRTSSTIRSGLQRTESDGINSFSDDRFDVSIAVTRNILNRLNGRLEYRFVDQSSDDNLNNFSENRFSASLRLQF